MNHQINHWLDAFKGVLKELSDANPGGDNIVIGGSMALSVHGLNIGRRISDMDVIIYQPTEKQKYVLSLFNMCNQIKYPEGAEPSRIKAIKLKKSDFFIDIMVESEPMPDRLLLYTFQGLVFQIQSIDNNIKAKLLYGLDARDQPRMYTRKKDIYDLQNLKNLNFNYEDPEEHINSMVGSTHNQDFQSRSNEQNKKQ